MQITVSVTILQTLVPLILTSIACFVYINFSNAIDFRSAPGMPKSVIAQFSTVSKDDKLKAYLNFAGGKQSSSRRFAQGDIVATYAVSDKFGLGINGTLQSGKQPTVQAR